MRIDKNKFSLILKALGVELCILAFIGIVILFQFNKAKTDFVNKTRAIAETIGEQANSYLTDFGREPNSSEFYLFLDERLGRKKLFNSFDVSPKFFSVLFKKDLVKGRSTGYFLNDLPADANFSVKKNNGVISVLVPFFSRESSEPFGVVKIDSDTFTILKKVFSDNFLLYVAMIVVLNNQAFITYLLMRKRKEVIFEQGYLKEHSIGALKIMHKVLGDIIEDHKHPEVEESVEKTGTKSKNVILFSGLTDKRKI